MLTASARPDPNAPFARAEIIVRGLNAAPSGPAFQLRRSTVDYVEPNLDVTGWTRSEVMLLPLDAWWAEADCSFHLLISGLLCQFIDPGPLKLRLMGPGGGETDLFWPEDISVYDDGNLAAHARVLSDTVRVVDDAPALPSAAAAPSPWVPPPRPSTKPLPNTKPPRRSRRAEGVWGTLLLPVVTGALVIGAVAKRDEWRPRTPAPPPPPPRASESVVQVRPVDEPPSKMRTALDRIVSEGTGGRRADFDPFLALRPTNEIIGQAGTPEALLRYGVSKLDRREPVAADRLFEEATRPRIGPAQSRYYAPAFVARALLYDPSIQHDTNLPVPNASFAETLYRRAITADDADAAAYASQLLQRLTAWQALHPVR